MRSCSWKENSFTGRNGLTALKNTVKSQVFSRSDTFTEGDESEDFIPTSEAVSQVTVRCVFEENTAALTAHRDILNSSYFSTPDISALPPKKQSNASCLPAPQRQVSGKNAHA